MKKFLVWIFVSAFLFSFAFSEDIVEGYWKSFARKRQVSGYWKIYQKDGMLYGNCILAMNSPVDVQCDKCTRNYTGHPLAAEVLRSSYMARVPLIYNLKKVENGVWEKGYIIDARNGRVYHCSISYIKADGKKFKEDSLALRGQISIGLGKTIYWEKASVAEINEAIKKQAEKLGSDYARTHIDEFLIK